MHAASSADMSDNFHSCASCGASSDLKRDDISFVEIPELSDKKFELPSDSPPVVAATEAESTPHPIPTAPTPQVPTTDGAQDLRLILTVPFSGELRRISQQVPLAIVFRIKRIFQALLIVFAMGFAAFFLRISGKLLSIVIRIAAFLIGNWLTRLAVFCVVAFGRPRGLNRRFGYRFQRVQERMNGIRVRMSR